MAQSERKKNRSKTEQLRVRAAPPFCSEVHKSKRSLKRRMKMSEKRKKKRWGWGGPSEMAGAQGLVLKEKQIEFK